MWGKLHCKSLMLVTADNCGFPFLLTVMITKTKVKRTFTEGVAGGNCCARGGLGGGAATQSKRRRREEKSRLSHYLWVLNSSLRKRVVAWNPN